MRDWFAKSRNRISLRQYKLDGVPTKHLFPFQAKMEGLLTASSSDLKIPLTPSVARDFLATDAG